jgi:hypothetical protein
MVMLPTWAARLVFIQPYHFGMMEGGRYIRIVQMDRIIDNFIIAARKYGLPVNFITRVRKTRYNFRGDASENFARKQCLWLLEKMRPATCSSVNLIPDVRESIETFTNRASSKLDVTSISTLYHESTHAYFYLIQEPDPTLLKFHPTALKIIEEGIKYYEKAPLVNGELADDPERVFMEAAATYVGSEIARWLIAYELLNRLLERLNRPDAEMIPLHIARQTLQKTIDTTNPGDIMVIKMFISGCGLENSKYQPVSL